MSRSNKSFEERLKSEREAIERAKARMRSLEQRQKKEERKKRTQRLIAVGAEVEHYAGCQITNLESFKVILQKAGPYIAQSQTVSFSKDQMKSAENNMTDTKLNVTELPEIKSAQGEIYNPIFNEQISLRDKMINSLM